MITTSSIPLKGHYRMYVKPGDPVEAGQVIGEWVDEDEVPDEPTD